MENTKKPINFKKYGGIAIAVILSGWMFVNLTLTLGTTETDGLEELHEIELRAEQAIAKYKLEIQVLNDKISKAEEALNMEREARDAAVTKRNEIINRQIEQPPQKVAVASQTTNSPYRRNNKNIAYADTAVNISKLAYAVAMAETHDCTLGYGEMYNNCFGIKRGSIVPCETGQNNMCIFGSKDEAYAAFREIWTKGYGGEFPSYRAAQVWTGNDSPDTWLENVKHYYYQ